MKLIRFFSVSICFALCVIANSNVGYSQGVTLGAPTGPVIDVDGTLEEFWDWWYDDDFWDNGPQGIPSSIPLGAPEPPPGPAQESYEQQLAEEYYYYEYLINVFLDLIPGGDVPENVIETYHEQAQDATLEELRQLIEELENRIDEQNEIIEQMMEEEAEEQAAQEVADQAAYEAEMAACEAEMQAYETQMESNEAEQ